MTILILAILATYRIARLAAIEEGPFAIGEWVRNRWTQDDWIGRGLRCPLCIGFWVALPAALAIAPGWTVLGWYWLGIAGAQAIISRALGDSHAG
jgi:hypothetical protein